MKGSNPPLSVCVVNYNHARYISEALESVLSQSYEPAEVIVVDDGSTDSSVEIIESFAKKHPVVRLIRNKKNMGLFYSLDLALKNVSCEYTITLASDDIFLPELFEKQMGILEKYPEACMCCCDSLTRFERTGAEIINKRGLSGKACYLTAEELTGIMRRKIVYLSGFGTIFKKRELSGTGFFPELKWSGDRIYATMIALRSGLCYVPEPLAVYRCVEGSYSVKGVKDREKHDEVLKNIFELLKTPRYSDVLPEFKRSCALASLHLGGLRVLAANVKYWDYLSPNLVRLVLWDDYTPAAVKKIYRALRAQAAGQ